jgi:hypothetical protein
MFWPPILLLSLFVVSQILDYLGKQKFYPLLTEKEKSDYEKMQIQQRWSRWRNMAIKLILMLVLAYAMYADWLPQLIAWLFLVPSILDFVEKVQFFFLF